MPEDTEQPEERTAQDAAPPPQSEPSAADVLERGPYEDGFSMRTVVGALFVAIVMMPGSIYLGLVAGATLGPAAPAEP